MGGDINGWHVCVGPLLIILLLKVSFCRCAPTLSHTPHHSKRHHLISLVSSHSQHFVSLAAEFRPVHFALGSAKALGIKDVVPPAVGVYREEDGFLLLAGLEPGVEQLRRVLKLESLGFVEMVSGVVRTEDIQPHIVCAVRAFASLCWRCWQGEKERERERGGVIMIMMMLMMIHLQALSPSFFDLWPYPQILVFCLFFQVTVPTIHIYR